MRVQAFVISLVLFLLPLQFGAAARAAPLKAAVFGLEFFDDTLEGATNGKRPDETARLALANGELEKLLVASGEYAPVDLSPLKARIEKESPLFKCNGCETDIARDLGADVAILGVVRKVSNLILSFTLQVREASGEGRVLHAGEVDIRGNTDESWLRAVRFLAKNRILKTARPPGQ